MLDEGLGISPAAATPADLNCFDLLHAGSAFGSDASFPTLHYASLNWHFLSPRSGQSATSWRATSHLCWLRPRLLHDLGGFDPAYTSAEARLMDMAYRVLRHGGRVRTTPSFFPHLPVPPAPLQIPLLDEMIFLWRHLGGSLALYAALSRGLLTAHFWVTMQAYRQARQRVRRFPKPVSAPTASENTHLLGARSRQIVTTITGVIPTLNRYDYLPQAIESLLQQSRRPEQIVVVDQTPVSDRRPELYAPYAGDNVQVIFLEQTGQSIARNTAVAAATGEWLLFFDDDSVAWDDMIANHVNTVEKSGAQASTGVSLAPWKNISHTPAGFRHHHITSVLDTGNSLVNKAAVQKVGGFDRAFDRGSGADNDLGTRLYLQGYEIVFTPQAVRTHYKAAQGGLRTHGAWWRHKTERWAAFPPPTQIYTVRRYYISTYWLPLCLLFFFQARRHITVAEWMWLQIMSPIKLSIALRQAKLLKPQFGFPPKSIQ